MATNPPKKGIKIKVGDRVVVTGFVGTIRFIGLTKFAPEKWVGVELDKPEGKNDGSVKGVKYFSCQPKYGLFAKPNMVRPYKEGQSVDAGDDGGDVEVDDETEKKPAAAAPAAAPAAARAVSPASPNPKPATAAPAAAKPATGLAKPAVASPATAAKPKPATTAAPAAAAEKTTSQLVEEKREALKKIKEKQESLAQNTGDDKVTKPAASSVSSAASEAAEKKLLEELTQANKEIEKLKKQGKDNEEAVKAGKEVPALKKSLADLQSNFDKLKRDKENVDDKLLEMGQDLELANEELSLVKLDLDELRATKDKKSEELLSSLPTDQAGIARLTETNNQLTAALRKLRDKYTEDKTAADEYRSETETTLATLRTQAAKIPKLEETVADLKAANEDLKQSLEESSGFEQMVEDLTEKNLAVGEKNRKLKEEVDYLTSLKQAAEEVEEGHVELENQLQAELESKEAEIQECHRQLKLKQNLIEDLNATQRQFRDLVKGLENEARDLRIQQENAQGVSRDESERSRRARIANLQLQSKVSEVRNKSVEHMLAKLESAECQTKLAFYESHIPDNVNIDNGALSFLLTLDRLNTKANSLARLLADSYGMNTHNEALAHFTYDLCSRLSDFAKQVDVLRSCVRRTEDEDLFVKLVGERDALKSPEAVLDEFLQMISKDSFSEGISLQAVQSAEENVMGFIAGYFMGEEDDRGNRKLKFPAPLAITSDVSKLYYQQAVVATYFQAINDILSGLPKRKDGKNDDNLQKSLDQLQQVCAGNSDLTNTMLSQAASYQVFAQGKGVPVTAFDNEVKACNSNVFACLVRVKQLFEWVNDLVKRGVDDGNRALIVEQLENRFGTETSERRLLSELTSAQMVLRELRHRLEAAPEGKDDGRVRASAVWEKRAGAVRQELLQAASLQTALEEATKKSEEKARELFLAQKKAREAQAKVDVLSQKLELVQGKADDSSELKTEVEKLRRKTADLEQANDAMSKDLEQSTEAAQSLRKKVLKLKYEVKQAKESGGGSSAGGSGAALLSGKTITSLGVAAAEINLLLRTIALLRQQLAQQRSNNVQAELKKHLPPLAVLNGHVVESGDNTHQHLQYFAPATKAEVQTLQTIGEELAVLSGKATTFRATTTLVDISKGNATQANQQWLSQQAEAFKMRTETAALREKVSSFLSSKQAQSFRCMFAAAPSQGATVPGAASTQLIGKVVVPAAVGGSMKAMVGRADFERLHSVFVQ